MGSWTCWHYFREYGVNDYAGSLPRIVLRTVGLEFLAEVKLHDVYVVTARTVSFRTTSWAMEYGVWTEAGLTTKGTAVLVNLNAQGQKEPLPDRWKDAFQKRDGALPA